MAITKKKKSELVEQYKEMLSNADIAVLARYQGLSVPDMTRLRTKVREVESEIHVVKNTLAQIALQELGVSTPDELWTEANALGLSSTDISGLAKSLSDFAKTDERLVIKAGFLGKEIISAAEVNRLANLPSRDVLLALVFSGMQSPITGFVTVMGGVLRGLVNVLDGRRKQLEEVTA